MLFVFFGKILFPRSQRWEQRRKIRLLAITLVSGCVGAACVGLTIYRHNR
jgi:hypothetical protein